MSPHFAVLIALIQVKGHDWDIDGAEGPRRRGHCAYCKGQCQGVTSMCCVRVYHEGLRNGRPDT
jgi:hypothetical protein